MFDSLYNYPDGYNNPQILVLELETIKRCDFLVFDPDNVSSGVLWEVAFAKWLGKPVKTFEEVLENGVKG